MAGTYIPGETKARPGVYSHFSKGNDALANVNKAGIVAAVINATWGPLNTPVEITGTTQAATIFGTGGTTKMIKRLLKRASKLRIVRAGTGGSSSSCTLVDTTEETAVSVILLTAKKVGTRGDGFSVTVADDLLDETKRIAVLYDGAVELDRVTFAKGTAEVDGLVAALANSQWVTPTKSAAGNGTLADVSQAAFTGGANPTAGANEYSTAMNALATVTWSLLCVDTNDTTIHAVAQAFIARMRSEGKRAQLVFSEPKSVAFATRLAHAAAFNSELGVYVVGGGIEADGTTIEGWEAAADIAGLIAGTPNNKAITHKTIASWIEASESFDETQIKQALASGVCLITTNDAGTPRVEQGLTTLVTPTENQDAGWKKIKRTRCRFELLDREDAVLDSLIGEVDNDEDGRGEFVMQARNVITAMIGEKKLSEGTDIILDEGNPPAGDSAWWKIAVFDPDTMEFAYLDYQTNFTAVA